MVVPLNEAENTNSTEEVVVTEEPVGELNDAVSLNDDVSIGSSERKESGVTEEVGDGGVEGSPAGWECPAAFVKKTFEMVEDPDTDPVVSWSFARDSFVVWEPHVFSNTILPKYFKHSNFSSFIRQLNTYGFRKVYSDRWEFANEGFQGGKKHLLKNIRRRSKCNKQHQAESNSTKPSLEDEVEKLKNDMSLLKLETLKLRHLHENTQIQLTDVEERVRSAELKQCRMLVFLTRIAKKPSFVEQFMQMVKRKRELDGVDMAKRRRLIETKCPHSPHSFPKAMDTTPYVDCRHQVSEQLLDTLQSELTGSLTALLSELTANGSSSRTSVNNVSSSSSSSAYDVVSEKLMGESSVVDEEVVDVHVSNMYLELEDLISKPVGWSGSASGLVGQSSPI